MTDWQVGEVDVAAAGLGLLVSDLERQTMATQAWTVAQVEDELGAAGRRVWLALTDEAAVGYALTWHNGDVVDLQRVGVVPKWQRHGIASELLAQAESGAAESGAPRMLLEVAEDNPAQQFYRRRGFQLIDRRERYYGAVAGLVMEREL